MPLFECTKCHVAENTATSNYWWDLAVEGKPVLCSECDPAIGKWHGHFKRMPIDEYIRKFGAESVIPALKQERT